MTVKERFQDFVVGHSTFEVTCMIMLGLMAAGTCLVVWPILWVVIMPAIAFSMMFYLIFISVKRYRLYLGASK